MSTIRERNSPPNKTFSDQEFIAAWNSTRSALKTAQAMRCPLRTVYNRLTRLRESIDLPEPVRERPGRKSNADKRLLCETVQSCNTSPRPFAWIFIDDRKPPISITLDDGEIVIEHPHGTTVSTSKDRLLDDRKTGIDESWWRPTIETGHFTLLEESRKSHRYRIEFEANQAITRGDFERIFTLGVVALHTSRGETPPKDGIVHEHERRDEDRTRL